MIHTSRRPHGARSLLVVTTVALFGAVPLLGSVYDARADGPVRPRAGRHFPPTHRLGRPQRPQSPQGPQRPQSPHAPHGAQRPQGATGSTHRNSRWQVRPKVAKVSIDTSAPGAPVLPGKVYNWPFVVKNQGLARADSVTFAAPLSGSLEFVSAQQNCSFKDSAAVCQLGSLKPGESKLGVLTAKVAEKTPGGQSIDGDAQVRWRSPQEKEGQATAAFPQVKVADTADVSVLKAGPTVIRPGERVPYEVTVANNGPTAARHVMLTSTSVPILTQAATHCDMQNAQGNGHGADQGNGQADGHGDLGRPVGRPDRGRSDGESSGLVGRPDRGRSDSESSGLVGRPGRGLSDGESSGPGHGLGNAAPGADQGLVCDIGTLQPGEKRAIKINAQARAELKPGTVIQAPSQVSTTTIDSNLANNKADMHTEVVAPVTKVVPVVGHAAPRGAPVAAPGVGPRGGPKGTTGLPNTGAPISELLHLVVMLTGMGLIFYRFGRVRRIQR